MTPRTDVDLVRDVLDTQVFDRHERGMGKVDGIGLELREGAPPRVAYLELDAVTSWARVGPRLARWAGAICALWRRGGHPVRVRWSQVRRFDIDVELDLDAEQSPAFDLERWLREHFVDRLPGSR